MIDASQYIYGYKFRTLHDPDNGIEYLDTHDVGMINAFFRGASSDGRPTTLITHNSDFAVSQAYPKDMVTFPENVIWYSTNVDVDHPNIRAIPIGLENPEWHKNIHKSKVIKYYSDKAYNLMTPVYTCNAIFNPNTHPSRRAAMDHFKTFYDCYCRESINGQDFGEYAALVSDSLFTVCPRGNGIDTHRLWEALYLGSIPLLEDNINIRFYKDLPIVVVDSFLSISSFSNLINDAIDEMLERLPDGFESRLTMDYWINKIRNRA